MISGCAGTQASDPDVINDAKVRILWPERTRDDVPSPGSAMSCHVFIEGGAVTGANVDVFITRDSNTGLHFGEYPIGTPITSGQHPFTSTFFAEPDQNGDVVGLAHGFVVNGVFKDIVLDNSVRSVKVIEPTTFQVSNTPAQMLFEADGIGNTVVAVLPGSDHWTLESGSGSTLSPDGLLTTTTAGSLTVKVTVDNVSSPSTAVTVTEAPIDKVTYEDLTGSGTVGAVANFVGDQNIVGGFYIPAATPTVSHAAFWSNGTRIDVNPPGIEGSTITAGSASVGVGNYIPSGGKFHAAIFTTGGLVDLDPDGNYSGAAGVAGTTVVGQSGRKACKWTGGEHTFVNLHPGTYRESYATGTTGDATVGWATNSPNPGTDAILWTGETNQMVILSPSSLGAKALCISQGTQGGYFIANGKGDAHACIWHGTAASYIDLNPSFAGISQVNAVLGDVAVGLYRNPPPINDQMDQACMWNGSSSKFLNLKDVLPSTFGSCQATSITAEPGGYAVAGWAYSNLQYHAILWHVPASLLN